MPVTVAPSITHTARFAFDGGEDQAGGDFDEDDDGRDYLVQQASRQRQPMPRWQPPVTAPPPPSQYQHADGRGRGSFHSDAPAFQRWCAVASGASPPVDGA